MSASSRLPKPSGIKPPSNHKLLSLRLPTVKENIATNPLRRAKSNTNLACKLFDEVKKPEIRGIRRRSKSVADLTNLIHSKTELKLVPDKSKPVKIELNKPIVRGKPVTSKTTSGARSAPTKRPLQKAAGDDGAPKPKVSKKIPDWDYKSRFNQMNEHYQIVKSELADLRSRVGTLDELQQKHNIVTKEYQELQIMHDRLTKESKKMETELKVFKTNLMIAEKTVKELTQIKETQSTELKTLQVKSARLEAENKDLGDNLREKIKTSDEKIQQLSSTVDNQRSDLMKLESERRVLHNRIQDLKGNIRVFARVRPPLQTEIDLPQCIIEYSDENSMEIRKTRENVSQITRKVQENKLEFTFDKVFPPESTQEEVFEELAQLVQSALDGYDVCVFAYGQTGSGKTHTMQGSETDCGMIPRTVCTIFENIAQLERAGWKYTIQASFLEIYNENVRDLLNLHSGQKLDIHFNEGKETLVTNLTIQPIQCAAELERFMRIAQNNRATAATNYNEHSSRSHAITKIYMQGVLKDQKLVYTGSVNLVDLAGSESAKQSVVGVRLTETKNINKSLSTLGDVIYALQNKSSHIPYRNSKLTFLLQSCLGGNSKTLMIVNIAPFEDCFGESINSLRFAAKAKQVKTGAKRNRMIQK